MPIWVKGLNKSLNHCRWADLSEPAKDLLLRMLEYDPIKRITSKQARTTALLVLSHCCCVHVGCLSCCT